MINPYLTFKKFSDPGLAAAIGEQLKAHRVDCLLEHNQQCFDVSFANNTFDAEICLKVKPADFNKAQQVVDDFYQVQTNAVCKEYYLFDFNDHELMEVIFKRDEWGEFDYQMARIILSERGKEVKPEIIQQINYHRIKELSKSETVGDHLIYRRYWSAFLGFPAVIYGYDLAFSKKTLPGGQQFFTYGEKERGHGRRIFLAGILCLIAWTVLIFYFRFRA